MKKILALFFTLGLAVSAKAAPLYANGVVASDGVTLSSLLSAGWSQVHNTGYGSGAITEAMISSWGAAAGVGGYVFVGGINQAGNVILGGTGLASEVLTQTFSNTTASLYSSSNLFWYNVDNNSVSDPIGAFGFAPIASINLFEADTSNLSDIRRLSWHLDFAGGGYRLGSLTELNSDNTYNRIVLVSPGAAVPETASTLTLLAVGLIPMVILRRRLKR